MKMRWEGILSIECCVDTGVNITGFIKKQEYMCKWQIRALFVIHSYIYLLSRNENAMKM